MQKNEKKRNSQGKNSDDRSSSAAGTLRGSEATAEDSEMPKKKDSSPKEESGSIKHRTKSKDSESDSKARSLKRKSLPSPSPPQVGKKLKSKIEESESNESAEMESKSKLKSSQTKKNSIGMQKVDLNGTSQLDVVKESKLQKSPPRRSKAAAEAREESTISQEINETITKKQHNQIVQNIKEDHKKETVKLEKEIKRLKLKILCLEKRVPPGTVIVFSLFSNFYSRD